MVLDPHILRCKHIQQNMVYKLMMSPPNNLPLHNWYMAPRRDGSLGPMKVDHLVVR